VNRLSGRGKSEENKGREGTKRWRGWGRKEGEREGGDIIHHPILFPSLCSARFIFRLFPHWGAC